MSCLGINDGTRKSGNCEDKTADADLATFFYYLGRAAQKAAPRYRKPLPPLTPEYLPGIATFTQRFFENIYARLKPPFAIVFDNYQETPEQSPLHDIMNIGLSLIPEGTRVFLLSRNDPPPAFMRLHANSAMHVVGWNELRFTREEAKGMVRLKTNQKLTEGPRQAARKDGRMGRGPGAHDGPRG